jgi:hypothetical protein
MQKNLIVNYIMSVPNEKNTFDRTNFDIDHF